jgi:hypothetical protein
MTNNTVAVVSRPEKVTIEDARIIFRNFEGKEGPYNEKGIRSFCVLLNGDLERQMVEDGWNVKYLRPTEPDVPPQAYLPVAVSYKHFPPKIVLLTSKNRTVLDEEDVDTVDWVDIKTADITINPSTWSVRGNSGVKAYLKTMYIIVNEDYLDLKYEGWGTQALPARDGRVDEGYEISDRPHYDYEGEVV